MVAKEWKACAGVYSIGSGCLERSRQSRNHEHWPRGSITLKKPSQGRSAVGLENPDDGTGTLPRVLRLQGTGGINPGGVTLKQMTYVVGS